jgi:ubiquinone/menaquinone biosynthesis C-methylase UbiE
MDKSVSLVSGIGDLKTTKKYYDDRSRKYDSTLNKWKYTVPKKSIRLLKSKFNRRPNKILDLACGTGLFGEELIKTYKNSQIYGADISEKSLIKFDFVEFDFVEFDFVEFDLVEFDLVELQQ